MEWSWKVFLIALPISIIFSMFSRGAKNAENVAKFGPQADYRANPVMTLFGSITGGAVWAAILTVIFGFF